MTKYFKSKKTLFKKDIIKLLFIILITYYVIKLSVYILCSTKLLHYAFRPNKIKNIANLITEKTINEPVNLLNINYQNNNPKTILVSNNIKIKIPKVYIYNSHPNEAYLENNMSIHDMDYIFKNVLFESNIDTFIEENDINNYLISNNLDYSYSYLASRFFIEENILNNNYDLIIDLHRDATNHDDTYLKVNDLDCVKILFVVGLNNPNYEDNYNLALKLSDLINTHYPNLSRGVMLKSGANVNGLYNQDLSNKMILLELGGNNNLESEVINTINLISPIIGEFLYGN